MQEKIEIYNINYNYLGSIKGKVYIIPSDKEKGFNLGYSLFIPEGCNKDATLLVNACNTGGFGTSNGKLDTTKSAIHLDEGLESAKISSIDLNLGMELGKMLKFPVLTPLIPRVRGYYTHELSSMVYHNDVSYLIEDNKEREGSIKLSNEEIRKIKDKCFDLPFQLVNIIEDSKKILLNMGIKIDDKVIIEGYSAGSKFANRFTALYPNIIKACIGGGTNGINILPVKEMSDNKLNFPLGVNDIQKFNADEFKLVPQYYFIGNKDFNDPAKMYNGEAVYKDAYTKEEATLINKLFGYDVQERFDNVKNMYKKMGINAKFEKFNGDHNLLIDNNSNFIVTQNIIDFIIDVTK